MLRDKNLVPLSRQHQHALALCVRVDRALQAGEVELEAWQAELQQIFESEIGVHFVAEEKDLFPAAANFAELRGLVSGTGGGAYCSARYFFAGCGSEAGLSWARSAGRKTFRPHSQRRTAIV